MLEKMDTFIYDLHSGRLDDLEFGIKSLTRAPLESEKTVIVITSILSWGDTEHKLVEDIPEPVYDEDGNIVVPKIENDVIEEKPEEEKENDETIGNKEMENTQQDINQTNKTEEMNNTNLDKTKTDKNNDTVTQQEGEEGEKKTTENIPEIDEEELKRQRELEELAKMPKKKVGFELNIFLLKFFC